jgi:hypothetical protein
VRLPFGLELRLREWPLRRRFVCFFAVIVLMLVVGYAEHLLWPGRF